MSYDIGFIMEQTLGHVTHDRNLRPWVAVDAGVTPHWLPIPFKADDLWEKAPGIRGNWTLRASLRARSALRGLLRARHADGLFFHTQVTALLAARIMRRIPTVVSLDATPLNVDTVGHAYDHSSSRSGRVEALKNRLNRRTFRAAAHLITWCDWAKRSLVTDYGVAPDRVTIVPPGVDLKRWHFERDTIENRKSKIENRESIRLLFVGGDFRRKGGGILLQAFRERLVGRCELDIVTRDAVSAGDLAGVQIHHGLTANSREMMALYEAADLFVFPTLGDCLPIAVMEAMASELPVVTTGVGALCEEVEHGVNGLVVPVNDPESLADAVERMVSDTELRREMGRAGRTKAEERFDAACNYPRVLDVIKGCVDAGR